MKRGTITIRNTNSDNIQIDMALSENGTIWMTKNEIASLFNVYRSSVEASLKSLFKSNRLLEKMVRQEEHCTQTNDKKCIVEYFNLEVIIALSYRIDSYPCIHFRQWVAKQVTLSCKKHFPITVQLGTTTLN
ncbi:MAG: virulence RhuM family protein [Paludibacter sp.]|nr:virulence RhuM family protein [Paludibacter sp.]